MEFGKILWSDLTVSNAEQVRDFYSSVVGWTYEEHNMGECEDFAMKLPNTNDTVAAICHAKGSNANMPPVWMMYVTVENLAKSLEECANKGGKTIDGPRKIGDADFAVIQDPAGAMIALIESK